MLTSFILALSLLAAPLVTPNGGPGIPLPKLPKSPGKPPAPDPPDPCVGIVCGPTIVGGR